MIIAEDAADLGAKLYALAGKQMGERIRFSVNPSQMTALEMPFGSAVVPDLTGHGDGAGLAEVIHSYHQWGHTINIGLIQAEGIFQFWVEKDDLV